MEKTKESVSEISSSGGIEIGLKDIIAFIRKYLWAGLAVAFLSAFLGILYSFTLTKTYEASTTLLPEMGSNDRRSLSSLAMGLASLGLSANDNRDAIRPDLYPSIVQSVPCILEIMETPVVDKDGTKFPSFDVYLRRDSADKGGFSLSFLSNFLGKKADTLELSRIKIEDVLSLDNKKFQRVKAVRGMVKGDLDLKSGVIYLSAETDDPFVSAIIAKKAMDYVERFVKGYRSGKVEQQLEFLKKEIADAKRAAESAQYRLNAYRDQNRNPFLNVARIEEQKLVNEANLRQNVFDELTRQFEEAKIKLSDEKPVFQILEPIQIPLYKNHPKRLNYAITFLFLGMFFFGIYVFFVKEKFHKKLLEQF